MRPFRVAVLGLALILLAGCPGETAAPPAGPRSFVLRAPGAGEVYVFKLLGGLAREDEVISIGTTTITIARSLVSGGKTVKTETVEDPLVGPNPTATLKPGVEAAVTGEETLTVSNIAFPCSVREARLGSTAIKEWTSQQWPHVLRTVSGPFVTVELIEVRPKKVTRRPEEKK